MAKIINNKRTAMFDNDEFEVDELGAETEAEKQMKVILQKQLNKNISLNEQFSQHRTFVSPSTLNSLTELVHGTCNLEKFKQIEQDEEVRQELQRCGLTDEEIVTYLDLKTEKKDNHRIFNPEVRKEFLQKVEQKIKLHNASLLKPQEFKNVKKLTRHEIEIERSLYYGCSDKSKLSSLVSAQTSFEPDGPYSYIKKLSDKLTDKTRRKKKKKLVEASQSLPSDSLSVENESIQYDPNIHHVNIPLEENEVNENRLSADEIKKLPRFENHTIGQPNKTLYLKNLHSKTTTHELRSLFGQFETENSVPICYKVCTGKMKGQAFITFSNSSVAERALHFANGYILRERPIIIAFGKQ